MSDIALQLFGVDDRDQYGLRLAFRRHRNHNYVIDVGYQADIALIDGDAIGVAAVIERELERERRRPMVIMALVNEYGLDDDPLVRFLAKPAGVNETLALLDSLAAVTLGRKPHPSSSAKPTTWFPATPPLLTNGVVPPTAEPVPGARPPDHQPTGDAPGADVDPRLDRRTAGRSAVPTSGPGPSPAGPGGGDGEVAVAAEPAMISLEEEPLGSSMVDATAAELVAGPDEADAQHDQQRPVTSLGQAAETLMGLALQGRGDRLAISAARAEEIYEPAEQLDGSLAVVVASGHRLGRPTALVVYGDSVCYDPELQTFTSTGYFDWLDALARSGAPCAKFIVDDAAGLFLAEYTRRSAGSILWRAALLAGDGRLRTGIDPEAPLTLRYWPDLTELDCFEGFVAIIAAIAARAPSIIELSESGHRRHLVNAAVGALSAINALVLPPEIHAAWHARPESANRGLLGRFRGRDAR